MNNYHKYSLITMFPLLIIFLGLVVLNCTQDSTGDLKMGLPESTVKRVVNALVEKNGEAARNRIESGVSQTAARWQTQDGSEQDFQDFCLEHFLTNPDERKALFTRFQKNQEVYLGRLHQISRQFRWALDVDKGKVYPIDYLYASFDPMSHVQDDAFNTKIAFAALLNYPLETLETKNSTGMDWAREKWAETRLAEEFMTRLPSKVAQKRSETYTLADDYIANYNIYMNQLVDDNGNRLFPEGLKLISHWGLRDELKAQYANSEGFPRQKMIQNVMERIIRQEIPEQVVNSEQYGWNPYTNKVFQDSKELSVSAEPNTRYQHIWNIYQAERLVDPYYPHAPSLIDRRFNIDRLSISRSTQRVSRDPELSAATKTLKREPELERNQH